MSFVIKVADPFPTDTPFHNLGQPISVEHNIKV